MKTIEVSDEVYEFLKDCNKELKTQDNRCTRSPIYTIWHKKRTYGLDPEYAENHGFVWDCEFFEEDEIMSYAIENGYIEEHTLNDIFNHYENEFSEYMGDISYDNLKKAFLTLDCFEQEQLLKDFLYDGIRINYYSEENTQVVDGACFSFFEKDAEDHIKMNKHNIKGNPYSYADSLYRSPRMEKLLEVLTKLELKD